MLLPQKFVSMGGELLSVCDSVKELGSLSFGVAVLYEVDPAAS